MCVCVCVCVCVLGGALVGAHACGNCTQVAELDRANHELQRSAAEMVRRLEVRALESRVCARLCAGWCGISD